jgi:hypothetical protein
MVIIHPITQRFMAKSEEPLNERLLRVYWPHTRNGEKWKTSSSSFKRLYFYAKKLSKLGVKEEEIASMFSDVYWDAFEEFNNMPKAAASDGDADREKLHFDEFGIQFRLDEIELTPQELARDFEFCNNLVVKGEKIWWTHSGGGWAVGGCTIF